MTKDIAYVGLDAHQERIHATVLLPGSPEALEDSFANTADGLRRWVKRLKRRAPGGVRCCYEAGPLGYAGFCGIWSRRDSAVRCGAEPDPVEAG